MARALIIADDCHLAPNDGENIEVYLCVFISRCVAFVVLDFTAGLSSAPYMAVTPFLRSLLKRIFFLPYAYYLCGCLLFVSSTFFVCFPFLFIRGICLSLLRPFLATMLFADYFSCPFSFCLLSSLFFFSGRFPGLDYYCSLV